MEKILKVCSMPYNGKQTNGINIKGQYLTKYDFEEGDFVKVTISKGRILIEKAFNNDVLRLMKLKNKDLNRLIECLDLTSIEE